MSKENPYEPEPIEEPTDENREQWKREHKRNVVTLAWRDVHKPWGKPRPPLVDLEFPEGYGELGKDTSQ